MLSSNVHCLCASDSVLFCAFSHLRFNKAPLAASVCFPLNWHELNIALIRQTLPRAALGAEQKQRPEGAAGSLGTGTERGCGSQMPPLPPGQGSQVGGNSQNREEHC